jgi:uncharacterized sodium:solute symporter family permease YidK
MTASVYTAILLIHKAWRLVTQVCIQNCYGCVESRTGYRNVLVTNILKPLEQCVFYISVLCCSHLFSAGPKVAAVVVEDYISNTLPNLLRYYDPKYVFNMDETGLFYRLLPNYPAV